MGDRRVQLGVIFTVFKKVRVHCANFKKDQDAASLHMINGLEITKPGINPMKNWAHLRPFHKISLNERGPIIKFFP